MIVVGTRPEIIKMACVIQACDEAGVDYFLVHTDQHFDEKMSHIFMSELEIGRPEHNLHVGSGTHGAQTGKALALLEQVLMKERPDLLLIQGDTNTVLAAGLAAVKLGIPIGHIEAGLRSYDLRMPEEHNRRVVDHISTFLFAPTLHASGNLKRENVWGDIYITGNTVIDACEKYAPVAELNSRVMQEIRFRSFALATVHRAENVDNMRVLRNLMNTFSKSEIPIVFPAHPRTMSRLKEYNLLKRVMDSEIIQIIPPVGYFDFLALMKSCKFILTDSGGVQEEATSSAIRKFVLVLRGSTDRPEAVEAGMAKVIGTNAERILHEIREQVHKGISVKGRCPYGNGKAAETIVRLVKRFSQKRKPGLVGPRRIRQLIEPRNVTSHVTGCPFSPIGLKRRDPATTARRAR
jgi:UDP-N-acetylglucosamine 2-epimerase (non-hydrolysing)